jgi:hypothetical protein
MESDVYVLAAKKNSSFIVALECKKGIEKKYTLHSKLILRVVWLNTFSMFYL